jgi:hypothetical protein
MQLGEVQVLKLTEDGTMMSKHVAENMIYRDTVVMYICAPVGCNNNNITMHGTSISVTKCIN